MKIPEFAKGWVKEHVYRPQRTVRPSPEAKKLAAFLSRPRPLSPETRSAVKRVSVEVSMNSAPHPDSRYETVADHFAGASSKPSKLALLEQLAVYGCASSVLEIGTAYGLSAITLALSPPKPSVVTIELMEPQATIGPRNIRSSGADRVECLIGNKHDVLPKLAAEGRRFDLVFHDGGHAGDEYVSDFDTIYPMLEPGSIYIVDDIAWDSKPSIRERTVQYSKRTCLEGWQELVRHPKVKGAIELGSLGLLIV